MEVKIDNSWKEELKEEFEKEYFENLVNFVKKEYKNYRIYPPGKLIFNAFNHCPFNNVKVVILGQDPYHQAGQANGLCFSVNKGVRKPPSLQNIFKEIKSDLGKDIPESGNLEHWAKQGVFMLNATLTVRDSSPLSHHKKGWEEFTDAVIKKISDKKENVVFLLWGNNAQQKGNIIDKEKHLILKSAHPSPLSASRGFFGNKHFSTTNNYLEKNGLKAIDW